MRKHGLFLFGAKNTASFMEVILRHYKLIIKKEVTKMDEMTNMNETTMENDTSVEVVPEENVQMIDNE